MTDAHGVDPNQEIEWIPTMKLSGSRSGNRVVPYGEIRWIPKRKFCMQITWGNTKATKFMTSQMGQVDG